MADTVTLSWGKPTIQVKSLDDDTATYTAFATPVEDSTQLNPTEGDKLEAKIEGGDYEAVKYKKTTYQLEFQIRQVPERTDPITDTDGVVSGEFAIQVIPEETDGLGITIERASCHVTTSYTAADGIIKTYYFDALVPSSGNATVQFETISA